MADGAIQGGGRIAAGSLTQTVGLEQIKISLEIGVDGLGLNPLPTQMSEQNGHPQRRLGGLRGGRVDQQGVHGSQ